MTKAATLNLFPLNGYKEWELLAHLQAKFPGAEVYFTKKVPVVLQCDCLDDDYAAILQRAREIPGMVDVTRP